MSDYLSNTAVVHFETDARGYVSGTFRGLPVYRDNRHSEEITPGETWVCSLELNPKTGFNYFATPVRRVDASYLQELHEDQLEEIADALWRDHRDEALPLLESRFREEIDRRVSEAVAECSRSYEARLAETAARPAEQDRPSEDVPVETADEAPAKPVRENTDVTVRRVAPDVLESPLFTVGSYFVHINAGHTRLLIRPSERGEVVCRDCRIALCGLGVSVPFGSECSYRAKYDQKYGFTVCLDEVADPPAGD